MLEQKKKASCFDAICSFESGKNNTHSGAVLLKQNKVLWLNSHAYLAYCCENTFHYCVDRFKQGGIAIGEKALCQAVRARSGTEYVYSPVTVFICSLSPTRTDTHNGIFLMLEPDSHRDKLCYIMCKALGLALEINVDAHKNRSPKVQKLCVYASVCTWWEVLPVSQGLSLVSMTLYHFYLFTVHCSCMMACKSCTSCKRHLNIFVLTDCCMSHFIYFKGIVSFISTYTATH